MFDEILSYMFNHDMEGYPTDDSYVTSEITSALYRLARTTNDKDMVNLIFTILDDIESGRYPWYVIINEMEDY